MPDFAFYSTDIDPTTDPANADPAPGTLVVLDQVPILGNAAYDLMAGEIGRGAVIQTLGDVVIQDFGVMDGDQRISFSDSDALSAETVADLRTIRETPDGEYFFTDGYDIWRVRFARPGGFRYQRNLFWAQHSQEIYSYEINLVVMGSLRPKIADFGLSLETAEGLWEIADCKLPLEAAGGFIADCKLPLEAAAGFITDCKLPLEAAAGFITDCKLPLEAAAWLIEDSRLSLEAVEGGFTPSGSPLGHWSADTITGLEDGDPVGTWPDESENGYDLVQAIAAAKPTYKINIQNGLSVVRVVGSKFMSAANIGTNYSNEFITIHIAFCPSEAADNGIFGCSTDPTVSNQNYFQVELWCSVDPDWYPTVLFGNGAAKDADKVVENIVQADQILEVRRDGVGVNVDAWVNGVAKVFADGVNYNKTATFDTLSLRGTGTGANLLNGDYFEIILYTSALSDADVASNRTGLNTKWAVY